MRFYASQIQTKTINICPFCGLGPKQCPKAIRVPWGGGGGKNKMSNNRKMNLHWIEQGISLITSSPQADYLDTIG